MKNALLAALALPMSLMACGDEVTAPSKDVATPAAAASAPTPAPAGSSAASSPAPTPPPVTEAATSPSPLIPNDVNDPTLVAKCAAQPALQHRGTFAGDSWLDFTQVADLTATISFGELLFGFTMAPTIKIDPTNGLTRSDGSSTLEVGFVDANWQQKLAVDASFQVTAGIDGDSSWCSINGMGGGMGGGGWSSDQPTGTLTITAVTATSIGGHMEVPNSDGKTAHFTFQAPLFTDANPDPTPSRDSSICCLK